MPLIYTICTELMALVWGGCWLDRLLMMTHMNEPQLSSAPRHHRTNGSVTISPRPSGSETQHIHVGASSHRRAQTTRLWAVVAVEQLHANACVCVCVCVCVWSNNLTHASRGTTANKQIQPKAGRRTQRSWHPPHTASHVVNLLVREAKR